MRYILELDISTDGDFGFDYVPVGMECDSWKNCYSLTKEYNDEGLATRDIVNICAFLKENIQCDRDWVKEMFCQRMDNFIHQIYAADFTNTDTYIYESMSGNYDGTSFVFRVAPCEFTFSLNLTDEEFKLVRKKTGLVTREQIKDVVMALYKEV